MNKSTVVGLKQKPREPPPKKLASVKWLSEKPGAAAADVPPSVVGLLNSKPPSVRLLGSEQLMTSGKPLSGNPLSGSAKTGLIRGSLRTRSRTARSNWSSL
jgi:hypothetical protein